MEDVQEKREQKHVPGGLKLHQYANLYFHARNPMLYKRKTEINNLCVAADFHGNSPASRCGARRLQRLQSLRPVSGTVAMGGAGL